MGEHISPACIFGLFLEYSVLHRNQITTTQVHVAFDCISTLPKFNALTHDQD